MKSRFLISIILMACAVRAGNPGDDKPKAIIAGVVSGAEDGRGLQVPIRLLDRNHAQLATTTSEGNGFYQLGNIPAGEVLLEVGERFHRAATIPPEADLVIIDVVVPVPAAPVRFRPVPMGPQVFCLLWDDISGFETSFRIVGPQSVSAPADVSGLIVYFPNVITHRNGEHDWPAMSREWSRRFAGTYFLTAENEYGASVSVATYVDALLIEREMESKITESDFGQCGSSETPPNFIEEISFVRREQ